MAVDTTRPRLVALRGSTGRVGRPKTEAGRADEAEMEAAVLRAETLASARRMRFVVLTSVWEAARKPLLHELDRIERRLADPERVA